MPEKPRISIAHVVGSGTVVTTNEEPTKPVPATHEKLPQLPDTDRSATNAMSSVGNRPWPSGAPITNGSATVAPLALNVSAPPQIFPDVLFVQVSSKL